jgi:hypothetical protein
MLTSIILALHFGPAGAVFTDNLNAGVAVMKSAQDGASTDHTGSLNRASVAVHYVDGSHLLEQDKNAQQNPISDWADDLWKTIARWLIAINAGDIDPASTTFRLYVTPVHEGGSLETECAKSRDFPPILASLGQPGQTWEWVADQAGIELQHSHPKKTFEISIEFSPI